MCSKEYCGGGTKKRTRSCTPIPICADGFTVQIFECNEKPCPGYFGVNLFVFDKHGTLNQAIPGSFSIRLLACQIPYLIYITPSSFLTPLPY